MTRTVGTKGQVVIPKAMRDRLGLRPGDSVEFAVEGESIRLIPARVPDLLEMGGIFGGSDMAARLLADRRAEPRRAPASTRGP